MSQAVHPGVLRAHLMRWYQAAMQQAERVASNARFDVFREMDAQLFAIAAHNVLRAAELAATQMASEEIRAAVDEFNAAVPDLAHVRNQLEHFDEYELGTGRLQTSSKERRKARARSEAGIVGPVTPYRFATSNDGATVTILVGDFSLAVLPTARALQRLVERTQEPLLKAKGGGGSSLTATEN